MDWLKLFCWGCLGAIAIMGLICALMAKSDREVLPDPQPDDRDTLEQFRRILDKTQS
jgi:hypothetical protein